MRPTYQFLRYNEDWSELRGVPESELTDFWDSIKYIPLSDDIDFVYLQMFMPWPTSLTPERESAAGLPARPTPWYRGGSRRRLTRARSGSAHGRG